MTPRSLLIVNPNTDTRVTTWLATEARLVARSGLTIEAVNAPSGLAALVTPQDVARAARAVVDAVRARPGFDRVLIGAFGDSGLAELRRLEPSRPVTGLGEAGMHAAAAGGRSFAIVTLGTDMASPTLTRGAAMGYAHLLADVSILPVSIGQYVTARAAHAETLTAAVRHSFEHSRIQAVLLGGAPFAGQGAGLQQRFDKPVLDGVSAGIAALDR